MPAAIPLLAGAFLAAGTVASTIGLGVAFAIAGTTITWTALMAVTGVALLGISMLSMKVPKPGSSGGQLDSKLDVKAPIPVAYGRTATGGFITYQDSFGKKNRFLAIAAVLSAGPIANIEAHYANDSRVLYSVNPIMTAAPSPGVGDGSKLYKNRLVARWMLGAAPATETMSQAIGQSLPGNPGKLSGLAHVINQYDYNQDAFPQGVPKSMWVLSGVKVYDPRKDSTYPGGSGSHRRDNHLTWEFSENPYLAALDWTRGRWWNGRKQYGIGSRWEEIDVQAFVNGANIADANGWKIGGVVTTEDDKFSVLATILQSGGGMPLAKSAQISCIVNAPKTSTFTLETSDLIGEVEVMNSTSWRDRVNTVVPSYREETQLWQIVNGEEVSSNVYVEEDAGEKKTVEVEYPLVQRAAQAHQLATYELCNSREFLTFNVQCKVRALNVRAGDAIAVNVPEIGAPGQKCLVIGREFNPSDLTVTLALKSETDAKHAFALGQSQVAPPAPALNGYDPSNPGAPDAAAWSVSGTELTAPDGSKIPAIVLAGEADDPNAAAIIVEYRPNGAAEWIDYGEYSRLTKSIEITSVTAKTVYDVAISYRTVRGVISDRLTFTATAGSLAVDWGTGVVGGGKPEDGATVGAPVGTEVGGRPVEEVIKDIDDSLNSQKDASGKIITAEQHLAAQKAASDEVKAARDEVAKVRSDLSSEVAGVKVDVDAAKTDVAKVKSDQAAENARLAGEVDNAKSEAASARADGRQGIADAATVASNLNAEVERVKEVEGTINQKIVNLEQQTDTNATSIRDEITARADADATLANRSTALETNFKTLPTTFTVIARGYDDASSVGVREAGLYDAAGNRLHGGNRAWNVVTFNADNTVKDYRSFDTWDSDNNSRAMAEYLSSLTRGTTVVCYTYDEPQNNRKSYGLEPALLDCGAGPAYLSNNFAYRAAYVLIGRKGVGANGGTEAYSSSWVERRFDLLKGAANLTDSRALADASARITAEESARASGDEAVARRATALESRATTLEGQTGGLRSADIVTRIETEETTRARADEAVATRTSTLEAKINGDQDSGLSARIRDQATAQTNATDVLATRFNTVEANYQNANQVDDRATTIANAKVSVEEAARTSADNALANRLTTVESSSGGAVGLNPNGDFSQGSNGWVSHPTAIFDFPPLGGGRGYVASTRPGERGELISTKMIRVDDLNDGLRLKAFFRVFAGTSFTYLGVQCFDLSGGHMGNIYVEAKDFGPGSYQINALLKGSFDTTLPVYRIHDRLPAGCAHVRVVFFGNYNNVAGTYVQASQVLVEDVGSVQKLDARVTEEVTTLTSANSALANRTSTLEATGRGSGNFISHTDFTSTAGWALRGNDMGLNNVVVQSGDYWNPRGESVLFLGRAGAAPQGSYSELVSDLFAVTPDSYIQLYAFVASHRARGWISVFFANEAGEWAGYAGENYAPNMNNGGPDLNGWDRVGVKSIKVPSNAVTARFGWRLYQIEGGENPAAWMFRPYVGEAKEGQTDWNPYVSGSARKALNEASARSTNEETARVNADSALATRSDTLEAQMRGERESTLAARIRDEASARADAVSAVATRTNTLEAKATSAADMIAKTFPGFETRSNIWGFDTTNWGRNAGDTAWEPNHIKGAGISFRPGFGRDIYMDPSGWIKTTPGTRYRAGFWIWQWAGPNGYGGQARLYWEGQNENHTVGAYLGSTANPPEATQAFYTHIPNGAWHCYASDIQVDDLASQANSYWIRPRINVDNAPAGAGYVIAGWFFREVTEEFKLNARISAEEVARTNADEALAGRSSTLEAQMNRTTPSELGRVVNVVDARVAAEETARANADSALATRNSTLEAQMAGTAESGLQSIINNNRNNLIDLSWWKRGATIPWYFNGGQRNEIVEFPHGGNFGGLALPDGSSGDGWLCQADSGGNNGGGWDGAPFARLDPDKTYRFMLPIAALDDKRRTSYWGTSGVADLNTGNENTNPYFALYSNLRKERWYLFVGFIYPRNSVGHTHDGAGIWDMATGEKIGLGLCFNFMPDGRQPIHRAYQFYADAGAYQAFGRPVVELVDGTESNFQAAFGARRQVVAANARITAEETARVNADSALATRANALEATVFNGPNQNSTLSSRITNEETARVNAINAVAQRSTLLEAYASKSGAINLNPNFSTLPSRDNGAIPSWWHNWESRSNVLRNWQTARGVESEWALYDHVTPASAHQGLYQDVKAGTGWYVIEATIEVWDGGLAGAGILLYALDTNGGARASATLSFAVDPPIGKTPQYITMASGGAASGVLRYSKLVNLAADDVSVSQYISSIRIYAMSNWDGFGTGVAYKQMAWHKASFRAATDAEVKGHKALPVAENAQARITAEETARADAVSALANRATSLEATVFNGANQNSTLSSRITNEETARVNAVSALANRASTLEARTGGSGNLVTNTTILDYSGWITGGHLGTYANGWINAPSDDWRPVNENVFAINEVGRNGASAYYDWLSDQFAVFGGRFYQFYAWVAAHRCPGEVYVTWRDASGTILAYSSSGITGVGSGGKNLNNWSQVGLVKVQAPANAATAQLVVRKPATYEGNADSWLWWLRPYFGEARDGQNEWNAFVHGSGRAAIVSANARITAEETARVNADGALATRANNVEARAGSLESRTGINESAIADARNKLASARLELSAVTGGGRAAITLRSDNNAGAGVDIVGDVNFSGNLNVGPDSGQRVKITNSGVTVFDGNGTMRVRLGIW